MAPGIADGGRQGNIDAVTSLLDKLKNDLTSKNLTAQERDKALEQLKIFGRDPTNAEPIFTKNGISILAQHALESSSQSTSREALRCLANSLLLKESTRQLLVDCGAAPKLAEKLKTEESDDEFLISRILFLFTYGTDVDWEKLVQENDLANSVNSCIARHGKRYTSSLRRLSHGNPMDDMALNETAKLVFNITHFRPGLTQAFSGSIPGLIQILGKSKIRQPPLEPPLSSVINALINFDLTNKCGYNSSKDSFFPTFDTKGNTGHIIDILDAAVRHYKSVELDQTAAPVVTLLRKIYPIAPEQVRKYMESRLLPSDDERDKPLGKSDTLASRLLQISSTSTTPAMRTSISALQFELSGKDADIFVRNVGYGYAVGFLTAQNIPVPKSATEGSATGSAPPINPVTGQRLDAEAQSDLPPMTDEEKEREAERLFVLFERLRATGVMDVKNPVQQAVEEGRFEELPDDYEEKKGDSGRP